MIVDAFLNAAGFGGGCFSIFSVLYLLLSVISVLFLHAGNEYTSHLLSTLANIIQIASLLSHFVAFSSLRKPRFPLLQNLSIIYSVATSAQFVVTEIGRILEIDILATSGTAYPSISAIMTLIVWVYDAIAAIGVESEMEAQNMELAPSPKKIYKSRHRQPRWTTSRELAVKMV
jgi:uncharacterized BrkB/YihY/UPF0761 family membrane protein